MEPQLKKHINNIIDTFSCADGGVKLVKFKIGMDKIEKQYLKGNSSARELIGLVGKFSKLLNVLEKENEIS